MAARRARLIPSAAAVDEARNFGVDHLSSQASFSRVLFRLLFPLRRTPPGSL
jgi:hypothetical protein